MKSKKMLLAVISLISLVSCGTKVNGNNNKEISMIVVGSNTSIEKANISDYGYEMLAGGISNLSLVRADKNGDFFPQVANYSTEDSKTWTYTIVDGLKWSDGEDVTAEDIYYSLTYQDGVSTANFVDILNEDNTIKTAKKYQSYSISDDKKSISLELISPNVRELSNMLAFRIVPKHIYENNKALSSEDYKVCLGPYVLDNFNKDSNSLTFIRNEYYPNTMNVKKIVYQLYSSEDVLYTALQTGDVDMVWKYSSGISSTYHNALENSSNVTLDSVNATNLPAVLAFNNNKAPFDNKNIRNAISYALDYEAFKTYFGSKYSQIPTRGMVPSSLFGYVEKDRLTTNQEKAKALLKEAGYETKSENGFYKNSSNEELVFDLTVNSTKATHVRYAEQVKTTLEAFGIKVNLDAIDTASYNAKTSNKFSSNNITMQAAIFGYTAYGVSGGAGLASMYVYGKHSVQGGCQVYDSKYETIYNALLNSTTIEDYKNNAKLMQDYYAEETPLISLFWDNLVFGYSSSLENVSYDFTYGINNVETFKELKIK